MPHSPLVFGVNVSSVVKQVLHHRHSVIASCKVERRGVAALQVPAVHVLRAAQLLGDRGDLLQPHSCGNEPQGQAPAHLHRVQVPCFGCLQESVVHIRVARGNIFYTFMNSGRGEEKKEGRSQSNLEHPTLEGVTTVEDLLYSLVAHLGGGEAL